MKKRFRLTAARRENLTGYAFLTPYLIGTAVFFLYPVLTSLVLSFGDIDKTRTGIHVILEGISHYQRALFSDTRYVPLLMTSIKNALIETPLTVILSLLIAIMLSKVKAGRGIFRVIYILPFLIGSGNVMKQLLSEGVDDMVLSLSNSNLIPTEYIQYLSTELLEVLDALLSVIVTVLWSSGVQILLFLSAIQSISPALYESAYIDGANQYELFWKITLPMVSPIMLLNFVYTLVNSFTAANNPLLDYIKLTGIDRTEFGYAASLGWIYFVIILVFVGIIGGIISRYANRVKTA